MRIGYLLPEFPGQTHSFFWRELQALEALGVELDVVSTRLPAAELRSHTWTSAAQARTTYLFPLGRRLIPTCLELLRSGPPAWQRCLRVILAARDVSLKGKLRLAILVLVGAELAARARQHSWTHVHVHSCADAAHVALFAAQLSGLTYSLTLHGPLTDYGPNQAQKWQFAQFAIVITQALSVAVQQRLEGQIPPRLVIAPMGVDVDRFQRQQPYQPWAGEGRCLLFSCGRLNRCKGHADLITAVYQLRQQGIEVQLEIAGEDEQGGSGYRQVLEQQIAQLGLQDTVRLLGAVSEDRVKIALESAHLFVLASLQEPLGVAIMEAMAMEVPVIVTRAGGVRELVEDGVTGRLVSPESPIELAAAIGALLKDPGLATALGQAAQHRIRQAFSHQRSAKVLLECLEVSLGK